MQLNEQISKMSSKPNLPVFNDGTEVDYELEHLTNTIYKSNDRKRWEFIGGWACPFRINYTYVLQRLLGDMGTPNKDGHDEYGWRAAPQPAQTRIVLMEMDSSGTLINVHSGVKKKQENS